MAVAHDLRADRSSVASERASLRRPCPVCGATRAEVLHTQHLVLPAEFELPETFDVVTCAACGMAYSDIFAEDRGLTETYRAANYSMHNWEDRDPGAAAAPELGSPVDVSRLRVVMETLARQLVRRDLRILDVGCASGTLLALLSTAGFGDVQGIDPSASAVASARRLGQRAWVGDLDTPLPAELGTFDVVILSHVLEHLANPRTALSNLRAALRPGALVYAEVPDAARYAEYLVEPFVDFNHEHVNHFSLPHLDELFRASGFVVESTSDKLITVVNWPYAVVYGMWRLCETIPDAWTSTRHNVDDLRRHLMPYVTGSRALLARYGGEIAAKLHGRKRVAVRCLGYRAWTLLGGTLLRDLDVVAYIDNAPEKQGLTVRGIRVVGPDVPIARGVPVVVLAYHIESAVVDEYAASDPEREVITIGRSRPASQND